MPLTDPEKRALRQTARRVRDRIIDVVFESGSGHVGAALSQADILVALYFRALNLHPTDPLWPDRDRFVLSKGHGGLGLVAVLAERGLLPAQDLRRFGETGYRLGMHMDWTKVPGVEVSTGSLGHGLGVSVGMALGARLQGLPWWTFCLLSDGELYEGSTWEAAISAAGFGLDRLVAIVDRNRLTMDGFTEVQMPLEPIEARWAAFGWRTLRVDGHDLDALCDALDQVREAAGPAVIIADTTKGRGVDFMEDEAKWHYGALDTAMAARARASIAATVADLEGGNV